MDVVIVESPAKARTINKYLGHGFVVLPSYGHVRDLPSKEGSVEPDRDFAMNYESEPRAAKPLKAIADAVKGARRLYLATDPDREGEAISWHVLQALEKRRLLQGVDVKRVAFSEITKTAVQAAMAQPRDLDEDLINAQQARRALDYLVGFTLSPILWRKLPGARSAGRVQSVALRLICEREMEIEAFRPREYWTIDIAFAAGGSTEGGAVFHAHLVAADGRKLDKFDLADAAHAEAMVRRIEAADFAVAAVDTKPGKRHPAPPFTTATLQQEAARKLGFSAQQTMTLAQRLYEGVDIGGDTMGLISYMRTDGVQMAEEAVRAARDVIAADCGRDFVPPEPRAYKAKARNAQEAHEAIRPTNFLLRPPDIQGEVDEGQAKLYDLIWKRAVASQMESAEVERTTVDIGDGGGLGLRASGQVLLFPGFLKLYEEGLDDAGPGEHARKLPRLTAGDRLNRQSVVPEQHFTEPPPRYSEASLVKRLEELGIGRPSTYASILGVLRERRYVRMDRNRFVPEDKGRLVTAFLVDFFEHYFAYDFTANLEERLDEIAERQVDWKQVLRDFWLEFSLETGKKGDKLLSIKDVIARLDKSIGRRAAVIDAIDATLGPHFFPDHGDGKDTRLCPACTGGRLGIKLGRNGAFIGCSNYPDCAFTRPLAVNGNGANGDAGHDLPRTLGSDPASGEPVSLRVGPYGPYVQLGEAKGKEKPKRASLPKDFAPGELGLEAALKLLSLPRVVGNHPESGRPITAGIGRYGPYIEYDKRYVRLPSSEEAFSIGLNRAVDMLASAGPARRRGQEILRSLGAHPTDGGPVNVLKGRYGPYINHGKINAPLPKGSAADDVTLEAAVAALAAKAEGSGGKPARRRTGAKASAGKSSRRKADAAE